MRLLMLVGRPACGKLTVAQQLAKQTGWRVFHNHLVVDAVLALCDFGTPAFVRLRDRMWRAAFEEIAELPGRSAADRSGGRDDGDGGDVVIFTFTPERTVPQAFIDDLFSLFAERGQRLVTVELSCPEALLEARMTSASRRGTGKLMDVDLYRQLRDSGVFDTPTIPRIDFVLDSSTAEPEALAERILCWLREHPHL